ncbi:MAG: DUF2569 domain-containing protein [Parabacteroides sp.]|nr:DUF2569 domain-containing protein [Parabacteroides sp.]
MIKDQCAHCKSKEVCLLEKVYDSHSCDQYVKGIDLEKQSIDLDKKDSTSMDSHQETILTSESPIENKPIITQEYLQQNTKIRGWLSFFLFAMATGGLFSAIYPIATFDKSAYGDNMMLAISDVIFGLLLLIVALLAVYAFSKRKPDAVFLAKVYVITAFTSNALFLLNGEFEGTGMASEFSSYKRLIWGAIWFLYLLLSKQVEEIIPKTYRKLKSLDYYVLATLIITPLFFLAVAIGNEQDTRQEEEVAFIQNLTLHEGEYTGGRIVFSSPTSFVCQKETKDGIVFYSLEHENGSSITICSDYDDDQSINNVNSYWDIWEDETAGQYESNITKDEKTTINGYTCYYKVKVYHIENNAVYWRFVLLFDNATSKLCLISCYDSGIESYIEDIIQSIRFR